jgi:three-Cys-motif partner protein
VSQSSTNSLFDRVGEWSLLKHDIVQYYAETYSNIMTRTKSQVPQFKHYYIDGYASAGVSVRKETDEIVLGSALRAASVTPPFAGCHLVELDPKRYRVLKQLCSSSPDVKTYCGDANLVLPSLIFPTIRYEHHERAFCLLDPYNEADLLWNTVTAAAKTRAIDLLIYFPIYSININVLHTHGPEQESRLNAYWGDDSWKSIAYEENPQVSLFRTDLSGYLLPLTVNVRPANFRFCSASPPRSARGVASKASPEASRSPYERASAIEVGLLRPLAITRFTFPVADEKTITAFDSWLSQ